MITLALEFSSSLRSAAVLSGESPETPLVVMGVVSDEATRTAKSVFGNVGQASSLPVHGASSPRGPGGRMPPELADKMSAPHFQISAKPLNLVESALTQASVEREAIDRIVVGLGPGSYTGIRSAIALAQGWQLARPIQLMGLSSVECLAAQAYAEGWFGEIGIAIDAQRNEVYFARYEISSDGWKEIMPLRLATLADVRAILSSPGDSNDPQPGPLENGRAQARAPSIIGPEVTRWFPAGRVLIPSAAALGRLAHDRGNYVAGEVLEPIYLRQTTFVKAPPPRILE